MEYWKEFIAVIGGAVVVWRFLSMNRNFLTKESHERMCTDKMNLTEAKIEVAVLRAMNQWLKENGHHLVGK